MRETDVKKEKTRRVGWDLSLSAPAILGGCFDSLRGGNNHIGMERTSIGVVVENMVKSCCSAYAVGVSSYQYKIEI